MNWSAQQRAIFDWFENGTGHLVVRARAGTGKTTTIIEAITHAPEEEILLAAFNKRIAEELTKRLRNPRAVAKTLHSVGFGLVLRQWSKTRVDDERGLRLARRAWAEARGGRAENAPDKPVRTIARLASLIKNTFASAPTWSDVEEVEALAFKHGVEVDDDWAEEVQARALARLAIKAATLALDRDGSIDFDDMVWLPVASGWLRATYDLVVVDEAQDMNAVQLAMAIGICKGRIAVVGDDKQAIYEFRGADATALDRLKAALGAVELPLTVTYRCPRAVVAVAQALCPDFQAAETNPEGSVTKATYSGMTDAAEQGDFILSRLNAPLARLCLALLRSGKPARIEGRDLTKTIAALIKRQKVDAIPDLLARLSTWKEREIAKLVATRSEAAEKRVEYVIDQVATIEALSDGLATTRELLARLDEMFSTTGRAIVLSSVHRAKGLEAQRVFVLVDTLYCNGKRDSQEERNIHYVAVTRAMNALVLVSKEDAS